MIDFNKKARELAGCGEGIGNYTEEQAKKWFYIEQALKEVWNEAMKESAAIADDKCVMLNQCDKWIRELKVKP